MSRPWKRNKRGGGKLDRELIKLTRQLFDKLKIPYHQAPGEAEAECAKMQALGIVDAVWSDDSDSLMFGCGTLIRQHKVGGKIVKDHVRIYRADTIRERHDLDSQSLVLFALLAGGDYDTSGLRGCGPKTAASLARRAKGLARALCHASERRFPAWRQELQEATRRRGIEVPPTFPCWKNVCNYRDPNVSTEEQLHNLRGLRHSWIRPINQRELRVMLRERFNFTTREFMKHITPIFLARALAGATEETLAGNLSFAIQLKRTRQKKDADEGARTKSEVKITFSPMPAIEIDLSQQPQDEDWTKFTAKNGTPYDPVQNLECEVLECLLRHGLPAGTLERLAESSKSAKQKRKASSGALDSSPTSKRRKSSSTAEPHTAEDDDGESRRYNVSKQDLVKSAPKKRGRPRKNNGADIESGSKKNKSKQVAAPSPTRELTPVPVFRLPKAIPPSPQPKRVLLIFAPAAAILSRMQQDQSTAAQDGFRHHVKGGIHQEQQQTKLVRRHLYPEMQYRARRYSL